MGPIQSTHGFYTGLRFQDRHRRPVKRNFTGVEIFNENGTGASDHHTGAVEDGTCLST
jgi:hypothetical protein